MLLTWKCSSDGIKLLKSSLDSFWEAGLQISRPLLMLIFLWSLILGAHLNKFAGAVFPVLMDSVNYRTPSVLFLAAARSSRTHRTSPAQHRAADAQCGGHTVKWEADEGKARWNPKLAKHETGVKNNEWKTRQTTNQGAEGRGKTKTQK